MTKSKENLVETVPATTAITKMIATVAKTKASSEAAEHPPEVNAEYTLAIEAVRMAVDNYCRSVWRLAWALVDFRQVHERMHSSHRLTDKQMGSVLGIQLTPARIGQLVNTAVSYPREKVDEAIDFRVYEQARTLHPRMTPEKRLKFVKDHPTTAALAKLDPKPRQKTRDEPELIIRVTPAVELNAEPLIRVKLNGAPIALPSELKEEICKYASNSFAEAKNS